MAKRIPPQEKCCYSTCACLAAGRRNRMLAAGNHQSTQMQAIPMARSPGCIARGILDDDIEFFRQVHSGLREDGLIRVQFSLAMQSSHRKDRQCRPQNGDCANVQHLSTSWQPMRGHLAVRRRLSWKEEKKHEIDWLAIDCLKIDRLFQTDQNTECPFQPLNARMWNRHAAACPG